MTKYREILRLSNLGLSQQSIADSCGVSKKTVNRVLKKAKEINISWPLDANDTDAVLAEKLFPSADKPTASNKRMPDFAYMKNSSRLISSMIRRSPSKSSNRFLVTFCSYYTAGLLSERSILEDAGTREKLFVALKAVVPEKILLSGRFVFYTLCRCVTYSVSIAVMIVQANYFVNNRRQDRGKSRLHFSCICPFLWTAHRFSPIEPNRVRLAKMLWNFNVFSLP